MPESQLPADVQRFLLTSVPSVPFLEALLLFHAERDRTVSVTEVSRRLYLAEGATTRLVDSLVAAGLVEPVEDVRAGFQVTRGAELQTLLDRVATSYAKHLIAMTHLIHDSTQRSATQFAEAFRLRKDR